MSSEAGATFCAVRLAVPISGRRRARIVIPVFVAACLCLPSLAAARTAGAPPLGTYTGETTQHTKFTMLVLSACSSYGPAHLCLDVPAGDVDFTTKCNGGPGGEYEEAIGPVLIPASGVVTSTTSLAPGTLKSRIVLRASGTASVTLLATAPGNCTSGKLVFTARRTGPAPT